MDIIGRIKQELNYDVFDSHSINYIYKAHLEKKEKYKCLTIGEDNVIMYKSDDCTSWEGGAGFYYKSQNIEKYMKDMSALSLCLENTLVEILGVGNFTTFISCNTFNNVSLFIGSNQASQMFHRFQDASYGSLLKIFINIDLRDEEHKERIREFYENTAFNVTWV